MPSTREEYVEVARALYETDDVQVDDDAKLSEVEEDGIRLGVWVSAWVWVAEES